jgi:protein-disulfide isomerase
MATKKNSSTKNADSASKAKTADVVTKESNKNDDVVTIDVQSFLTPIAIIIAGMMISTTLFFSLKDVEIDGNVKGATTTTANTDDGDSVAAAPSEETFPEASITIDDDPILGDKDNAKIAIVEFSDFECPFCARHWEQTHGSLVEQYIESGDAILVFRDLPLSFHTQAEPAAVAASCARDQGGDSAYYDFHDKLFESGVAAGDTDFDKYAGELGLNMDKFNECQVSGKFDAEIQTDIADGNANGCTGTPCFIIGNLDKDGNVTGGKRISGAYPLTDFQTIIEELL